VGQKLITIIFLQSIHSLLTKLFCLRCYRQKVIKTIIICSFNESIFDYLWNEQRNMEKAYNKALDKQLKVYIII